jgi:CPA2 family monovalent cation:H+ antiporter-2
MDKLIFLQDMAIVMTISAVIMILFHRLRLPVVLGYILAGLLVGPNTPPFPLVKDLHSIEVLAELGVIFLLFSIGLEFSFTRLKKVGIVAFFAATFEIALMLVIGFYLGKAFGWNSMDSLFLGAVLSISSTTIIAKILIDTKKIKEKFAQVILGILVIEDLLAIVIIAVLSGIATTGSAEIGEVAFSMLKVSAFVLGVVFVGLILVPKVLAYIEKFENTEMLVITVLGLCFGVSLLAAKSGFSVALGAFLIGATIAETKQVKEVLHKMEPIRDMFTAIFFVSVGMLLAPKTLGEYALPIAVVTIVTILGKIFSCSIATFLTGHNPPTSLKVGLGLAQIGEFSFIIAMLGESTGVTSPFLYPIAVSVSGITALTTPLLMNNSGPISNALSLLAPKPLVTASGLYTGWIERIRTEDVQRSSFLKKIKPYLPRLIVYGLGFLSVLFAFAYGQKHAARVPYFVYWGVAVAVVLPLILSFAHTLDRFLWALLRVKLDESQPAEANITLQKSLRFLVSAATGVLFFAAGSAAWPLWTLGVTALIFMLIAFAPLWNSITSFHEHVEKTVLQVFDQEKPETSTGSEKIREELMRLIREEYPINVKTEDFLLPFQESALNRPIRDLGLRSHTGATIVAIYRGDDSIPNPSPETALQPGDVLMLMGEPAQIKAAIQYLSAKSKEPPAVPVSREGAPRKMSFRVPPGSPLAGKTLRDLKLRRNTGATVLGIQKEDMSINNPDADTSLEEGDTLILFGWQDQLDQAVRLLSGEKPTDL